MDQLYEQAIEEMTAACVEDPSNLKWFEGFAAADAQNQQTEN